ncbi:hypothetical protein PFISCL1PPCAC_27479 [Pristionchus fissidentatus]|uniref:Armadillo-like helical domain-containing protein n=1 Tax=Pristionchus fissidentatus TaxID=1538716 RepID=A0AAV5WYR7_9BILA|nr:hypothetical protein PFISCL1PPCAC_27479 [Pristionchus fissidentatus]
MDPRKPKILVRYDEIFSQDLPDDDLFWDEIFLLKPNTDYLIAKLKDIPLEKLVERKSSLRRLVERSAVCVSSETSVAVFNACQTFTMLLEQVTSAFGFSKAVEILFDDAQRCFTAFLRRFYFFVVESVQFDLKNISLHFTERLALLPCTMDELPVLSSLVFAPALDVFIAVFAQSDALSGLGRHAIRSLSSMLARVKGYDEKNNALIQKFASIHDEMALQGLAQLILEQIEISNENSALRISGSNDGILSKISSIFSGAKDHKEGMEAGHDASLDMPCLFIFFESIRFNKSFVSTILTTRSSLESSSEEKERSLLLRHFFTFCSLSFEETKADPGLFTGRLCLLSLLRLTDDVFVQNTLHDPHNVSVVPLFRPAMLHRPAVFDCKRPACTLGSTALDLITELLVSHLRIGYPLEFHELALGIVHRILAYQKNRCIRMSHWQPLFNAMLSLMRFLLSHEAKFSTSIYPLCFRIIIVINLFLTFGDTFLPSGEAYDLLYYELVRQESVFTQLSEAVERRLAKDDRSIYWEMAARVKNHLVNPCIIINTIKEKIAQAQENTKNDIMSFQIIELIRASFETLSLKLYDGLTTVTAYDDSIHIPFFLLIASSLHADAEKRKATDGVFDYHKLVDNLSSIQD